MSRFQFTIFFKFFIKNGQISLYCHFNKIIKGPGTIFQSPALSQKDVRNVCHSAN